MLSFGSKANVAASPSKQLTIAEQKKIRERRPLVKAFSFGSSSKSDVKERNAGTSAQFNEMVDAIASKAENTNMDGEFKGLEAFRVQLKKNLKQSFYGQLYEQFFIAISMISALQYMYSSYLYFNPSSHTNGDDIREKRYMLMLIECLWSFLFFFDLLLSYFVSDRRATFFNR